MFAKQFLRGLSALIVSFFCIISISNLAACDTGVPLVSTHEAAGISGDVFVEGVPVQAHVIVIRHNQGQDIAAQTMSDSNGSFHLAIDVLTEEDDPEAMVSVLIEYGDEDRAYVAELRDIFVVSGQESDLGNIHLTRVETPEDYEMEVPDAKAGKKEPEATEDGYSTAELALSPYYKCWCAYKGAWYQEVCCSNGYAGSSKSCTWSFWACIFRFQEL